MRLHILCIGIFVTTTWLFQDSEFVHGLQNNADVKQAEGNKAFQAGQQTVVSAANQKPYKLSCRVHIQEGTTKGYLIVQVDLEKGSYIYSLTQKGDVSPSKLTIARSPDFRLLADFTPEKPASVIEKDPLLGQRIEKHKDAIQFFAPIEIAPGADVTKVVANVTFDGQVCSDKGFCMPVRNLNMTGKFAGYFQRSTVTRQANANATASPRTDATSTGGAIRR